MSKKLLKFSKRGCVPCVMVGNYLKEKGVETIDLDVFESSEAIQYGISSVPTLILIDESGDILDRKVGFNPDDLEELISKL